MIHIWGSAGNEGKTAYIKHKLLNSKIFGFFSPLYNKDEIISSLIERGKRSYYFADITRVVEETTDLFKVAEQLNEEMLALTERTFFEIMVVVFSNDLPPLHCLSRDRWEIYRINYDTAGASNLQQISKEDYSYYKKEETR